MADHHHHVAGDVDQVADLQSGCRLHALVAAVAGVEGEAVQRRADALRTGVARQLDAEAAVDLGHEAAAVAGAVGVPPAVTSEEHTSELPSLMRSSYAVFCVKRKTNTT